MTGHFVNKLMFIFTNYLAKCSNEYYSMQITRKLKYVGDGCHLNGKVRISSPENVKLGGNVHIGDGAWIRGEGGLEIGNNTHISRNVTIYTANHNFEGEALPYDETIIKKSVFIGENVWIGMNVCIVPGTYIGEGVIVGMGTTVSGHVPPFSIIGCQKYRVIRQRNIDHYNALEKNDKFGGVNGKLNKKK